ncbi:hypothetical protein [Thaumasiovibrio sp. DFM-14]|uniref:hypothetical protein n=1 Tax=Thaumasiovibrio sp. DFM-14 TaxID=3384792 RepID=UPI00399F5101
MHMLFIVTMPMALGALAVICLCLYKGEICPGQRGRLHKWLPLICVPLAFSAVHTLTALIPLGLLIGFCLQVKTGKTRNEGPRTWLLASLVTGAVIWLFEVKSMPLSLAFISLFSFPLMGCALAHFILVSAKSRLQAFHRILPVTGVIATMLMLIALLGYWSSLSDTQLIVSNVLVSLVTLIFAALIWVFHVFRATAPNRWQLLSVMSLLLFALLMQH